MFVVVCRLALWLVCLWSELQALHLLLSLSREKPTNWPFSMARWKTLRSQIYILSMTRLIQVLFCISIMQSKQDSSLPWSILQALIFSLLSCNMHTPYIWIQLCANTVQLLMCPPFPYHEERITVMVYRGFMFSLLTTALLLLNPRWNV